MDQWAGVKCVQNGIATLDCISALYKIAIAAALDFVGVVALFLIIVAGIRFIASGGGKEVEAAKNMLTYAIIGLIIVLVSFFIVSLISGITGVTCLATFSLFCQ